MEKKTVIIGLVALVAVFFLFRKKTATASAGASTSPAIGPSPGPAPGAPAEVSGETSSYSPPPMTYPGSAGAAPPPPPPPVVPKDIGLGAFLGTATTATKIGASVGKSLFSIGTSPNPAFSTTPKKSMWA